MTAADYVALQQRARREGMDSAVVGAAVHTLGRILLLKRRPDDFLPDHWEIPGGHVEEGESIPQAVRRELKEETGWDLLDILGLLGAFDYPGENAMPTREWNFLVTVHATPPPIRPEHQAFAWATARDIGRYRMTRGMRRTVERTLGVAPQAAADD